MDAEGLFDEVCAKLISKANRSKMFGAPCMKTANGKAAFCLYKNYLVVKPDAETLTEILSWDRVTLFTPMGDRPMKGWAQLGLEHAEHWLSIAEKSVDYVATLEAKIPKRQKATK